MKRKEVYSFTEIDKEFEKIEKLGYTVYATEDGCQILDGETILIDADFKDTYEENASDAINSFWFEK